jgi:hypothetical protein
LEDVDDKLAETLFGEEMAAAAAEVAAMVAANEPESPLAGAALELLNDTPTATEDAATRVSPKPGKPEKIENQAVSTGAGSPPPRSPVKDRRLAAADASPAVEITLQSSPDPEPPSAATPEPIEEQFGTSMTATLKALSAAQVEKMDESANDEDEEKPARKLFGLFRSGN